MSRWLGIWPRSSWRRSWSPRRRRYVDASAIGVGRDGSARGRRASPAPAQPPANAASDDGDRAGAPPAAEPRRRRALPRDRRRLDAREHRGLARAKPRARARHAAGAGPAAVRGRRGQHERARARRPTRRPIRCWCNSAICSRRAADATAATSRPRCTRGAASLPRGRSRAAGRALDAATTRCSSTSPRTASRASTRATTRSCCGAAARSRSRAWPSCTTRIRGRCGSCRPAATRAASPSSRSRRRRQARARARAALRLFAGTWDRETSGCDPDPDRAPPGGLQPALAASAARPRSRRRAAAAAHARCRRRRPHQLARGAHARGDRRAVDRRADHHVAALPARGAERARPAPDMKLVPEEAAVVARSGRRARARERARRARALAGGRRSSCDELDAQLDARRRARAGAVRGAVRRGCSRAGPCSTTPITPTSRPTLAQRRTAD